MWEIEHLLHTLVLEEWKWYKGGKVIVFYHSTKFSPLCFYTFFLVVIVQSLSQCPTLCSPMDCSTPGFPVLHHLLEFAQTHVYWVGDAIQPSHPLLSPFPPALNLSQHQGLFQWVNSSRQVSFSFNISPCNECSGLISFRMDWLDLLAVQGTLKSLLQHHSSKASILRLSSQSNSHIHTQLLEKP